jgi:hypothetical protein
MSTIIPNMIRVPTTGINRVSNDAEGGDGVGAGGCIACSSWGGGTY